MNSTLRIAARAILAAAVFVPPLAHAVSPQRVFVAGTGVDNPSCSVTSPCRAFGAALGIVASGGEVVVLSSAAFGAVSIASAVSLIAPPGRLRRISVLRRS